MLSCVALIRKIGVLQNKKAVKVLIIDDTNESKRGKNIEGVCDLLWSNKDKKSIRGINMVSLNYSDGLSNFMLDFALKFNDNLKIKLKDFKNQFYHTSNHSKRKQEGLKTKLDIALNMVRRDIKAGIEADYLLVDSWYAKPIFIKNIKACKLNVIARITTAPTIWQFRYCKPKTLSGI